MSGAFSSYYDEEDDSKEKNEPRLIDGAKCRIIASEVSKSAQTFSERQKSLLGEMQSFADSLTKLKVSNFKVLFQILNHLNSKKSKVMIHCCWIMTITRPNILLSKKRIKPRKRITTKN